MMIRAGVTTSPEQSDPVRGDNNPLGQTAEKSVSKSKSAKESARTLITALSFLLALVGGAAAGYIVMRPYFRFPPTTPVAGLPGDATVVRAAFLLVAGAFCSFVLRLAVHVKDSSKFTAGPKWGTLGGGGDGYELSPAAAILAAALACLVALAFLAWIAGQPEPKNPNTQKDQQCGVCAAKAS